MVMKRVQSVWSGLAGSPYLSTHYFRHIEAVPAQTVIDLVEDFWTAAKPQWAVNAVINVLGEVAVMDEATGDVVEMLDGNGIAVNSGSTQAAEWSGKQGILKLQTDNFVGGRRTRGRMFLGGVPSNAGEQVPVAGYQTAWALAGAALITASATPGPWVVWSRAGGASHTITQVSVGDSYGFLSSRRS